jgi:hypothetical protein
LKTADANAAIKGFLPTQLGLGTPNATEAVAMGVQAMVNNLDHHGNWAILQVDLKNAFNNAHRQAMLQAAISKAPCLFNYLKLAYGQPAPLFCGSTTLSSEQGTHQGCPMGPVGFSLVLRDLAEKIRAEAGLLWSSWYLDDGVLIGQPENIQVAINLLREVGPTVGLHLNDSKSTVWGPAGATLAARNNMQSIPWEDATGIRVLGVPVTFPGSDEFTRATWSLAQENLESLVEKITSLGDAQIAHHLLRTCADGCKLNHLLRSCDTSQVTDLVQECSSVILNGFEDLLGCALSPAQWSQVSTPLSLGGCGLKDPMQMRCPARLAALATFHTIGVDTIALPEYARKVENALVLPIVASAIANGGSNLDPLLKWQNNPSSIASASKDQCSQKWWSKQSLKIRLDDLTNAAAPRDQARLFEQRNGIGPTWMRACPQPQLHTTIPSEEYILQLKWWLGMPILSQSSDNPSCPGCGTPLDQYGDHLVCCPRNNFANRHNALQEVLFDTLCNAGQGVAKEVTIPNQQDQHLRPADLLLSAWDNGEPTALDITVVHSWQVATQQGRERWRCFLKQKEKLKHEKYDIPCRQAGWNFSTAALGTWGGWGPEASKILRRIVKRAAAWQEGELRGHRTNEIMERLGLCLSRQICRLLLTKNYVH